MAIWTAEIKEIENLQYYFEGKLPELEKELEHLIKTEDPNVILLYSRRCLEVIITDLCECELKRPRKTEPLKGIIDKLNREEKVPSHILTSMDSLNRLAAFGTHPKEYDPEQVRPVLIDLYTIIRWYLKFKNVGFYAPSEEKTEKSGILRFEEENLLKKSEVIINYTGPINSDSIGSILTKYKQSKSYGEIDKITRKRVYAIIVECLDNISKHSYKEQEDQSLTDPSFSIRKQQSQIVIKASNILTENNKKELADRIDMINKLDEEGLKLLYNKRIKDGLKPDGSGAGLGFITIALKSGNKIHYSFPESDFKNSFVEIQIYVNTYTPKKLIIKQTDCSPKIYFDPFKNIYEISGESRPDDVPQFYEPVLKWLDEFSEHLDNLSFNTEPVEFNLDFEYFNSLSAKYIFDFCRQLAKISLKGKNILVKWYYEDDDTDMLEAGKEIARISKVPFEFIPKK
jgi:hypothetical protein